MDDQGEELVYRQAVGVAFRRLSGEAGAVLLNLRTGAYHRINPTGAIIWELMQPAASAADISRGLADVASLPVESVVGDVNTFLADLADRGLAELAS